MAGKPREFCKIVPEEMWAKARVDYCAGMTAKAVCARYGMGESGLRGRARRERWLKGAEGAVETAALALERATPAPPAPAVRVDDLSPDGISRAALASAAEALVNGRPEHATAVLRALEDVSALAAGVQMTAGRTLLDDALDTLWHMPEAAPPALHNYVERLAEVLVGDGRVGCSHAAWAFRWRAERLGPEAAERDRAFATHMGWADRLYDEEGRLREA